MKVRIRIDKVLALKAGHDAYGLVVQEVPAASLTAEQRETLSQFTHDDNGQPAADFYLDRYGYQNGGPASLCPLAEATPDAVSRILDAVIAHNKQEVVKNAEKEHKQELAKQEKIAKIKEMKSEELVEYHSWKGWKPLDSVEDTRVRLQEAWAICKQHMIENENRRQAYEQEKLRLAQEKEEQKKQGIQTLKTWAETNGSDLLKARIAEGFDWVALSEQEWSNVEFSLVYLPKAKVPAGCDDGSVEDRTMPTLSEIQALREVRDLFAGHDRVDIELIWATYEPADDEGCYDEHDDDDTVRRAELSIGVECPTGRRIVKRFVVEKAVATA